VGLPVNLRGLAFKEVAASTERQDGAPVLVVEGRVSNLIKASVAVPRLRFALRERNGTEIHAWTGLPDRPTLAAGESLPFRTRLTSPPAGGHEVVVRFVSRRDAPGASR
jgi:hypothetical protein